MAFGQDWVIEHSRSAAFAASILETLRGVGLEGGNECAVLSVTDLGGDQHAGRFPVLITFASSEVIFKPRRADGELLFEAAQELISQITGFSWTPYLPRNLGKFSLWEPIRSHALNAAAECCRFYRGCGIQLALAHVFCTSDLNHENLMVHEGMPRIVDAEFVMQPSSAWFRSVPSGSLWSEFERSVLSTLMLPLPGAAENFSALGDAVSSRQPNGTRRFSSHRPRLGDQLIDAREFVPEVVAGFQEAYRAVIEHKEAFLDLATGYSGSIRIAVRPTRKYVEVEKWLWSREVFDRPAAFRRRALERDLLARLPGCPPEVGAWIAMAEATALLAGDIPLFRAHPREVSVSDSSGMALPLALEAPPLARVLNRISQLGEEDLPEHIRTIRTAMLDARLAQHHPGQTGSSF